MNEIDLYEIHPSHEKLTHARIYLRDNYLSLLVTGKACALQMNVAGKVLLESQLSRDWTVVMKNGILLIYTLKKDMYLPKVLFYCLGDIHISEAICCDWEGNTYQPYLLEEPKSGDNIDNMGTVVEKHTSKGVDLYNTAYERFGKSRQGPILVPRESLEDYKEKKLEDIQDIVKSHSKYKGIKGSALNKRESARTKTRIKGGY